MLSASTAETISIRGYDLAALIGVVPFPSVVHLLYTGELPDPATARLIDAVMVASIDHGAGPPSVLAARTAISGGASLPAAAAAGLLTFGDFHGAAVEVGDARHRRRRRSLRRLGHRDLAVAADDSSQPAGPTDDGSPGSAIASTSVAIPGSIASLRSPGRSESPATMSPRRWRSRPA